MSNKIKMYKLFLISLILTASLSLSFSKNNYTCEEKKDLYELNLSEDDPDVVKFADDGWAELVAEGRTRGATERGNFYIHCAKVQVADIERRYTILVRYDTDLPHNMLDCFIFVMTTQKEPLSINCFRAPFSSDFEPAEREQYNTYDFFYNNRKFCPRRF